MSDMRVWIDQDLCTGDGICVEICEPLFEMNSDGLAYVREENWPSRSLRADGQKGEPDYKMHAGLANVPEHLVDSAIEAAEECPGECIFFDVDG